MTAPDEFLAPIRERLAAATEGPWVAEYSGEQGNCVIPHDAQSTREAVAITRLYHQQADAEFIAHAREDVPRLLAALDGVLALADDLDRRAMACRFSSPAYAATFRETSKLIRNTVTTALEGQG
uniref:hypothetical protein n=1 Tax=Arthrobacter silvisoli TaxID=2291022 RepID=UPI003F495274